MSSYSFSVLCLTLARYLFTENFGAFLFPWMVWEVVVRMLSFSFKSKGFSWFASCPCVWQLTAASYLHIGSSHQNAH